MSFVTSLIPRHAYLAALRKFDWKMVGSLTQDGSKYSSYMSPLQDVLQKHGIEFITNRKFPADTTDMSLVSSPSLSRIYYIYDIYYTYTFLFFFIEVNLCSL